MSKSRALSRSKIGKAAVAAGTASALVVLGLSAAVAPANADVTTKVVYQPLIGAETADGWPTNPWFVGYNASHPNRGTTESGSDLSLNEDTQLLYQLPTPDTDLTTFIDNGFSFVSPAGGNPTFQIYLTWGSGWTTLRSNDSADTTAGMNDSWTSSKPVTVGGSNNTIDTLGNLIADVDTISGGTYAIRAVGVYGGEVTTPADSPTLISSITFDNTKYTFSGDLTVPTPTTTSTVQLSTIGLEGTSTGTNPWFYGQNADATPGGSVVGGNFVLQTTASEGTQLLHQYTDADRPASLDAFVNGGSSFTIANTTPGGTASFQLPFTYGANNWFDTLRTDDIGAGTHDASYAANWQSSHVIPKVGTPIIQPNTDYTLAQIVSAIDGVGGGQVIGGFGVQATQATSPAIASIQAGSTKYVFADSKTLGLSSVTIGGSAVVGQTVSANAIIGNGVTAKYQWYENGTAIKSATASTYTIPAAQAGVKLTVKVTISETGYTGATKTSAAVTVGKASFQSGYVETIGGDANVGSVLTATVAATPTPSSVSYQWYRSGAKISGATKKTYTLTVSDLGSVITVHSTASLTGFTSVPVASGPTDAVTTGSATVTAVTLTGTATVGKTLTAHATASTGGTKLYAFVIGDPADAKIVQFSSSATYKIPSYLKGQTVSVIVTVYAPGYASATATSTPTAAIS